MFDPSVKMLQKYIGGAPHNEIGVVFTWAKCPVLEKLVYENLCPKHNWNIFCTCWLVSKSLPITFFLVDWHMNFSNSNKTFFGDLALQCFETSCTHRHTHTPCHVPRFFKTLADTFGATFHDLLYHLHSHSTIRCTPFCSTCTHTHTLTLDATLYGQVLDRTWGGLESCPRTTLKHSRPNGWQDTNSTCKWTDMFRSGTQFWAKIPRMDPP